MGTLRTAAVFECSSVTLCRITGEYPVPAKECDQKGRIQQSQRSLLMYGKEGNEEEAKRETNKRKDGREHEKILPST